jgi:hypothetical protein
MASRTSLRALRHQSRTSQARFGRVMFCSGSNSLTADNDSASLRLTSAMSLSAWVRPTFSGSGWKTLLQKERSRRLAYSLYANLDQDHANSRVRIGSADRHPTDGSHLASNACTHLAATYDGLRQSLFVNGTQVGSQSQPGSLEVSANPLRLGGNTVWSGEYFQGLTDGGGWSECPVSALPWPRRSSRSRLGAAWHGAPARHSSGGGEAEAPGSRPPGG